MIITVILLGILFAVLRMVWLICVPKWCATCGHKEIWHKQGPITKINGQLYAVTTCIDCGSEHQFVKQ